jgi:putative Mg2+ transporter-C (MgtC) family protein
MSAWWHTVGATLQAEFSDLSDPAVLTRTTVRLLLAAALFVLIPQQSSATDADMTRVIQGLVAGIGFIGAGAILRHSESGQIEGLTTAASVWLTAAIGVAVGMGREATAILCTLFALGVLSMLPRVPPSPEPPPKK